MSEQLSDFENIVKVGSEQGLPISAILQSMSNEQINEYLLSHCEKLQEQCDTLSAQYKEIASTMSKSNADVVDRIDHILSLMTSHMMFIKQMIEIEEKTSVRTDSQEKLNAKQELAFAGLIDRQNRFSQAVDNMNKNTKKIMEEIEYLRSKEVENDKFRSRMLLIGSIGSIVLYWLMSGNNLTKVLVFLNEFAK